MQNDVWTYRNEDQLGYDATSGLDLSGYHVEALDGSIGKIDEATYEVGKSSISTFRSARTATATTATSSAWKRCASRCAS